MQKYLFPLISLLIILTLWSCFKPTALITYTDKDYLDNLGLCIPYTAEGKLTLFGNKSSVSRVKGIKNGKCVIQTTNTFSNNNALAVVCSLDPLHLSVLRHAREKRVYHFNGYNDGNLVKNYIKEGYCSSYKLKKNVWVKN